MLIRGESGVGKELVARAVHFSSPAAQGAVRLLELRRAVAKACWPANCSATSTGPSPAPRERKIGKFEAAHHGTLMLDEIGEMSPAIQAKFLRVLEGHPFERVGGSEAIKVDVRVIAATNRDLERAVVEGHFRRDLYFRLHVLEIVVPGAAQAARGHSRIWPNYFLQKFNAETGRKMRGFTPAAIEQMLKLSLAGQRPRVEERGRAGGRAGPRRVDRRRRSHAHASSPPPATRGDVVAGRSSGFEPISLDDMERRHILATLNATGWNKSQTASILGIERSTLDRKIRRYELDAICRRSGTRLAGC